MQITLLHQSGMRVDAVVLSVSANRLRIIAPGDRDTSEVVNADGSWWLNGAQLVEVESLISANDQDAPLALRTAAAGN